ncbi:hypothetical protein ACLBWC_30315, partial [Pseudomonas aeruginosa]
MSDKRNPRISSRKQPQQARSSELVASILEAAVQVEVQRAFGEIRQHVQLR